MSLFSKVALVGFAATVQGMKFGLMSDLHLKLDYDPMSTAERYCNPIGKDLMLKNLIQGNLNTNQLALLGRLGCDAAPKLVEYIA